MYRIISITHNGDPPTKHKEILGCIGKIWVAMVGYNLEISLLFDERDYSIDQMYTGGIVQSIAVNENHIYVTTQDTEYILESAE